MKIDFGKNSGKTKKLPLLENSKGYCHRVVNSRNVFRRPWGKFTVLLDLYKVRRASVDKTKNGTALFLLF
jgi:hypothetical protein